MGASKTHKNAKRFYYWPCMFDWIFAITADCLTCQNMKQKPKQRNEVPLEVWQNETVPFRTIHINHHGPLLPPSNRNLHCLLVIDAFSHFLMVYPVTNSGARSTISAADKWIDSFGVHQSFVHARGTAFINTEFVNWKKRIGIHVTTKNSSFALYYR